MESNTHGSVSGAVIVYAEMLYGCMCHIRRSYQILNICNNVTFVMRSLYKIMCCSALGNGDIQNNVDTMIS